MPTFTQEVTSSANDGWASSGASLFSTTGVAYLGAADLDGSGDVGDKTWCWWRFTNVTIPKNSTVSAAYLELTTDSGSQRANNLVVNIGPEAADNPAAPTTSGDLYTRTIGSTAAWTVSTINAANTAYQSPDLATPLTSHFSRAGWASGNALQLLAQYASGDLTTSSGGDVFGVATETADTAAAGENPYLSITYTTPAGYDMVRVQFPQPRRGRPFPVAY